MEKELQSDTSKISSKDFKLCLFTSSLRNHSLESPRFLICLVVTTTFIGSCIAIETVCLREELQKFLFPLNAS